MENVFNARHIMVGFVAVIIGKIFAAAVAKYLNFSM